jgi:uptake hydrogenase large subunit
MTPEGRIVIDLYPGARDGAAAIASSRPLTIPRQFSGQSPEKVLQTVSLLFAACKTAQSIAAAEAFEGALGIEPPPATRAARAALILAETAREHALRILMDWPQFLRAPGEPDAALLRAIVQTERKLASAIDRNGAALGIGGEVREHGEARAAISELKSVLERVIFRCDLDDCRAMVPGELGKWARDEHTAAQRLIRRVMDEGLLHAGAAEVSAMPGIENSAFAERLFSAGAEAFIARPDWEGAPRETSPLSRSMSQPLVAALRSEDGFGLGARLVACLMELAAIPPRLRAALGQADAEPPREASSGNGRGVAQVEAARGLLVHAVELEGGKVARYRILAPTEWNFHPSGAVSQGLARIAAGGHDGEACAWLARLFVISADPCVAADVKVR